MSKTDLVRRSQAAAKRSSGGQRGNYDQDLRALGQGRSPIFNGKRVHGEVEGWGEILTRPGVILFLSCVTFVAVILVMLWREGKLDDLFSFGPKGPHESIAWIVPDVGIEPAVQNAGQVEDTPNEMESMLTRNSEIDQAQTKAAIESHAPPPGPELAGEIIEE